MLSLVCRARAIGLGSGIQDDAVLRRRERGGGGQVHHPPAAADDPGHHRRHVHHLRRGLRPPGTRRSGGAANGRVRPATSRRSGRSTTSTSRCWSSTCCTWATCSRVTWAPTSSATRCSTSWPSATRSRSSWRSMAIVIEIVIGITAGVLAGIRRGKFIDNLVTGQHAVLDLHPDLRHRQLRPADLRGRARAGSRSPPPRAPRLRADHARLRAGLGVAGLRRPADAGQPGREPARRLRAHREGQGPDQRAGPSACTPCATR